MMARAPAPFRQADITRAVRGVKAAGEQVERVKIDRAGAIIVITKPVMGEPAEAEPEPVRPADIML